MVDPARPRAADELRRAWFGDNPSQPIPDGWADIESLHAAIETDRFIKEHRAANVTPANDDRLEALLEDATTHLRLALAALEPVRRTLSALQPAQPTPEPTRETP